ncbi:MAG: class E sortase [Actinobacteria bacterium]|nr:class E sortase [Actinomycetota bacterium]MBV9253724.1 class E sortase [Actinomycetota bacterium]MBV9934683.1 class E sortase [Actinomycetota bacterium]
MPLSARKQLARAIAVFVCVLSLGLAFELTIMSTFQQRAAQQRLFDRFRKELATGVAPIGPADHDGKALSLGAPVAYLEVPSIGLRQVVVEGTTSGNLTSAPGHRRDTPLPGQAGVSLVAGRLSGFGGPFARIHQLKPGAKVHVTTGQGAFDYRVIDVRRGGDPQPPPFKTGSGRLILATADGHAFVPSGVLWVDADLNVPAVGGPGGRPSPRALPPNEQLMSSDTTTLWALAFWLQALLLAVVAAIWAWHRWNRAKTWVVFTPALLFVGLAASGEAAKLLPNLL